jgi:hypothetical protein
MTTRLPLVALGVTALTVAAACGTAPKDSSFTKAPTSGEGAPTYSAGPDGGGGATLGFGDATAPASGSTSDPTTCAEAATTLSYVGCDYWPTPLTNVVWTVFDFAVVVSNGQSVAADVTVTGPNGYSQQASVAPNQLTKIYLPWNPALKGPDFDVCATQPPWGQSIVAPGAAFHLVSSVPVTVYEFSALEYGPQGGPPGKDWSSCPGNDVCMDPGDPDYGAPEGCFSYSNDAALLLPSTAMTGNYRIMGITSLYQTSSFYDGTYFAVTGTKDGTNVSVTLSSTAQVAAGGSIQAAGPGDTLTFTLDAGDVVEVSAPGLSNTEDLSGSLLKADQPVQVIAGHPCFSIPQTDPTASCDHLEQTVFPVETLGTDYVVNEPTGPAGAPVPQVVRFYGNVDGTSLTYQPSTPSGCPTTINAGQVVDCGQVSASFSVSGDHEFGVGLFMMSAEYIDTSASDADAGEQLGDPSMSFAVAVQQYRSKYIFLAPSDYTVSYADVIVTAGTSLVLDGAPVTLAPEGIDGTYSVVRVPLDAGSTGGAHLLTANNAFGVQVLGYAPYTSYQYPAGLDLKQIAPVPSQ